MLRPMAAAQRSARLRLSQPDAHTAGRPQLQAVRFERCGMPMPSAATAGRTRQQGAHLMRQAEAACLSPLVLVGTLQQRSAAFRA